MNFADAFAGIAAAFSADGGGPYFDATASWAGTPVTDDGGSIVTPGSPVQIDCQAQGDRATEAMRQAEGFLETDVALLVLGLDLLDTSARIEISTGPHAGVWTLKSVERDPVGIGWLCRGRRP
ncbi:hypothetical protein [Novosphingobium olei]|uniref:hypothetical protein n=1 Tax=Novosphingobium olei TaxID=2728851 RepID=UPI0030855193|nr:PepSY domain-containing protein [Novosphingobium olei]